MAKKTYRQGLDGQTYPLKYNALREKEHQDQIVSSPRSRSRMKPQEDKRGQGK